MAIFRYTNAAIYLRLANNVYTTADKVVLSIRQGSNVFTFVDYPQHPLLDRKMSCAQESGKSTYLVTLNLTPEDTAKFKAGVVQFQFQYQHGSTITASEISGDLEIEDVLNPTNIYEEISET